MIQFLANSHVMFPEQASAGFSLTQIQSTTEPISTNIDVSLPEGLEEGDLVIVFIAFSRVVNSVDSSGWTQLFSEVNAFGNNDLICYYKIMGATPDTSFDITADRAFEPPISHVFVVKGANQSSPISGHTVNRATSNAAPNILTLAGASDGDIAISVGSYQNLIGVPDWDTPPAGWTYQDGREPASEWGTIVSTQVVSGGSGAIGGAYSGGSDLSNDRVRATVSVSPQ